MVNVYINFILMKILLVIGIVVLLLNVRVHLQNNERENEEVSKSKENDDQTNKFKEPPPENIETITLPEQEYTMETPFNEKEKPVTNEDYENIKDVSMYKGNHLWGCLKLTNCIFKA